MVVVEGEEKWGINNIVVALIYPVNTGGVVEQRQRIIVQVRSTIVRSILRMHIQPRFLARKLFRVYMSFTVFLSIEPSKALDIN